MKKSQIIAILNQLYPFDNQEEWDFCGYDKSQSTHDDVIGILITLDLNWKSIQQAIEKQCNVIITHHPLFKNDLEHPENYVLNHINKEMFAFLQENKILHISLHTCFDRDSMGTSYQILKSLKIFKLIKSKTPEIPYLIYGELENEMTVRELTQTLSKNPILNNVRYIQQQETNTVQTVCLGAGSCSSYLNEVIQTQVDCFLTGDFKWHGFQDAFNAKLNVVDIGHDAEQVFIETIYSQINKTISFDKIYKFYNPIVIKDVK